MQPKGSLSNNIMEISEGQFYISYVFSYFPGAFFQVCYYFLKPPSYQFFRFQNFSLKVSLDV
ncbi:hypothetical protein HI914_03950 [Erysiphe necator]|nr:hypothetical protein HI914_03950 [Erysiphe necator]